MSRFFKDMRVGWILETIRLFGFINRHHVERKFDVSTPQASQDLRDACDLDPGISYDKSAKRYVWRRFDE